jgi:hypothetical protein
MAPIVGFCSIELLCPWVNPTYASHWYRLAFSLNSDKDFVQDDENQPSKPDFLA